ncbi:MAG: HEAT repeat domain-containing protein [Anaerolineaceae bacterium]
MVSIFQPSIQKLEKEMNVKGLLQAIMKNQNNQGEAVKALLRIGEPAINELIVMFGDKQLGPQADSAFLAIVGVCLPNDMAFVSSKLIESLNNPNEIVRGYSAKALGYFSWNTDAINSVRGLMGCLKDPSPIVRYHALRSLNSYFYPRVEDERLNRKDPILFSMLTDLLSTETKTEIREAVKTLLKSLGYPDVNEVFPN